MGYLMGIDIGTSGTKTLLIRDDGRLVAKSFADYPLVHPKPGWAEQDPSDWWNATVKSIREVLAKGNVSGEEVLGLGLSGQMHGAVLLDKTHRVLRPAILWCDQRTAKECDWITAKLGRQGLNRYTCNPALTGFTAPKIIWVKNNEPEIFGRIDRVLLPKDYIRFRLTGIFASEVSDASGTLLFDVQNRRWSAEMMKKLGLNSAWLPEVFESPVSSGKINRETAEATGLKEKTPVVGGGGDQAAGAVGNGVVEPGIISSTIGTSGVVFAFTASVKKDPLQRVHSFCHAVPGKWHVMGVMLAAGGSFQWFRNNMGEEEMQEAKQKGADPYEILTAKAATVPAGSEGLIFLPYLMGERTPYPDPNAKAVFFGINPRHKKAHMIRAVMEGVAFGLRDSLEIFRTMKVPIRQIRASGGGGRSSLWRQIQSDIFNTEIVTINAEEGPAFGVALLAGVGTGVYSSVEEACRKTIKVTSRTSPQKQNAKLYDEFYGIYRSLYRDLKSDFKKVSKIIARGG